MRFRSLTMTLCSALMLGCQPVPTMKTVESVDLERFMGDWYVIAGIPTFIEKGTHNAVDTYTLNDDETIAITFRFNKDGFDGEEKTYHPKGFVVSDNNAEWEIQPLWPFRAEYLVVYLDEDYQHTIIGRSKRDYIWIMARTPQVSDDTYQTMIQRAEELGYDTEQINPVPQQWSATDASSSE
ncbi:MAG: lipocalin family protein [Pseudomonadota bacterium]